MTVLIGSQQVDVEQTIFDLGIPIHWSADGELAISCPWPDNHIHGSERVNGSINMSSGMWVCYKGCGGGGGNLEKLVQLVKNVSSREARTWLLHRSESIEFSAIEGLFDSLAGGEESEKVVDFNKILHLDYDRMSSTKTSSYILDRGFTPETLYEWGFKYDEAMRAIVIPVYDISGNNLVGIVRRMVPPVTGSKYLYPPLFRKQSHLFGAHKHKSDRGAVILVEGPLDAIWLHQNGYTEAVALLGSMCSETQQRILARLGQTIILALDNDSAGMAAMERIVGQLDGKFQVMYTQIIGGAKDVQDLGKEDLDKIFAHPKFGWEPPF